MADWDQNTGDAKAEDLWARTEASRYGALPDGWPTRDDIEEFFATAPQATAILDDAGDSHANPTLKPIHRFGVVARGTWHAVESSPFSGAFAPGATLPVLLRYSLGVNPAGAARDEGAWHLGIAVKLLFDGQPSANMLFLHNFEGVDDPQLLSRAAYTTVRAPTIGRLADAARSLQDALDQMGEPRRLALSSATTRAARVSPNGAEVPQPSAPRLLRIGHLDAVAAAFDRLFESGRVDFREALVKLVATPTFAEVHALDALGNATLVATIGLASGFVASQFGDELLRFAHEPRVDDGIPDPPLPTAEPSSPWREFRSGPGPRLPRRRPTLSDPVDLSTDFRGIDGGKPEAHGWNKAFRAAIGGIPILVAPRGDVVLDAFPDDTEQPAQTWLTQEFDRRVHDQPELTWLPILLRFLQNGSEKAKATWQISEESIRKVGLASHPDTASLYDDVVTRWAQRGYLRVIPTQPSGQRNLLQSTSWSSMDPHESRPGTTAAALRRSAADLPTRVLNGIAPVHLNASAADTRLYADISFLGLPEDPPDALRAPYTGNLPGVTIVLEPSAAAPGLAVTRIAYRYGDQAEPVAVEPPPAGTATGAETAAWAHAQRLARMVLLIAGETDWHIARAHVLTEQYFTCLVAVFGDPEEPPEHPHPMDELLRPHLRCSDRINNFGDPLIFGPAGILANATALTPEGVTLRIHQQLGTVDWLGFAPRTPVNEHHTFARAGEIYWQVCKKAVHAWFTDHPLGESQWAQVGDFFATLVRSSVPYNPEPPPEGRMWRDPTERARDIPQRPRGLNEEGVEAAMHPLSTVQAERQADLEQLCAHAIFHATFLHSWTGAAQFRDGYDPIRTPMGLRSRDVPQSPPEWVTTGPRVEDAGMQMAMAELLSRVEWGYLLKDEPDRDAVPHIRRALIERWMDLEEAGVKPYGIRARINN